MRKKHKLIRMSLSMIFRFWVKINSTTCQLGLVQLQTEIKILNLAQIRITAYPNRMSSSSYTQGLTTYFPTILAFLSGFSNIKYCSEKGTQYAYYMNCKKYLNRSCPKKCTQMSKTDHFVQNKCPNSEMMSKHQLFLGFQITTQQILCIGWPKRVTFFSV